VITPWPFGTVCQSRLARTPNSAATPWFDPTPLMPALVDDFAELKSDPTMGMRARLLGADRVESRQGQDTEEFDPLAAPALHWPVTLTCWPRMPQLRHDATLARMALGGSSSQTNADFDLSWSPTLADVEVRL
jgi:hypothetical protein